ncbi:MAG: CHRD domain-containing protein [Synechococcaceae cyanobacterium SM2_3_2]|nr:CHRD domain-containing protein [Synechococcaceae cyanobacterium SM2_3_2]
MLSFANARQPKKAFSTFASVGLAMVMAALLLMMTGCSSGDSAVAPEPINPVVSTTVLLTPEAEVPPVDPTVPVTATGEAEVSLNTETGALLISGEFTGLTSPLFDVSTVGPVHVHLAAAMPFAQSTGGVAFVPTVTEAPGRLSASFVLNDTATEEQVDSFLAGAYYINVHTDVNPSGELRGQIVFP